MESFIPYAEEPPRHHRRDASVLVPPSVLRDLNPATIPDALPCRNFYKLCPQEVGALANVVVRDAAELERWLLVAQPVEAAHALECGGCLVYMPTDTTRVVKRKAAMQLCYYSLPATDDEVYGRAAYIYCHTLSSIRSATSTTKILEDSFVGDTSGDGVTEEQKASCCPTESTSLCNSSFHVK